jgi:hypothetical protein
MTTVIDKNSLFACTYVFLKANNHLNYDLSLNNNKLLQSYCYISIPDACR